MHLLHDIFADPTKPTFVSLDNEPELWPATHAEIQPTPPDAEDYIGRTIALLGQPGMGEWAWGIRQPAIPDPPGREFMDVLLELADRIGLDTILLILDDMREAYGDAFRAPPLLRQMVAAGRLGRKSGRGFYDYS